MGEWQPISTAPKDEDILVVHRDNRSVYVVVEWDEHGPREFKWATLDGPHYHQDAFSHWLPLPEPPRAG